MHRQKLPLPHRGRFYLARASCRVFSVVVDGSQPPGDTTGPECCRAAPSETSRLSLEPAILHLDESTLFASIAPPAKQDRDPALFAWRRGRAAEGTRLLNEHTPKGYRGFESLRLRHSLSKPHRHWPLYSTRKIGKASPEEAMGALWHYTGALLIRPQIITMIPVLSLACL